jgi:hypothetical protein
MVIAFNFVQEVPAFVAAKLGTKLKASTIETRPATLRNANMLEMVWPSSDKLLS